MKKSVRCLAFLLSVVMLLGVFAVTSFAEGEVANVTIKTNTDIAVAGEVITVTVNVANNYYATSMRWPVLFSSAFFELVEGSLKATTELEYLYGSVKCTESPSNEVFTSTYSSDEYTGVLLQWTAAVDSTGVTPYSQSSGMDCFTFQLEVKEDVQLGDKGNIVIPEDYPRFYNYILTDMEEPFSPDKVVKCENLVHNFTNATVSYGEAEILPVEDTEVVIDKVNGIIRGVPINTSGDLSDYVYAVAGELKVTPVQEGRIGTGTKVELVAGGKIVETYTIIIAGDLNGDALVDYTDLILFDEYVAYAGSLRDEQKLAAELNDDDQLNATDLIDFDAYLNFECEIDQATGTVV